MAITLKDVKDKNTQGSDSLLDIILKRKERKAKLRQKGLAKSRLQRPWESSAESIEQRGHQRKSIMKPYQKGGVVELSEEEKLLHKITVRAKTLFSNLNLKDL
ncbi:MAG: hypothetical protein BM556_06800 [Bacteriovorax sp. MedPE-SWde]|nr:MAG: hypothetical protein BM556_06800 [Bacteriovorax sp. MedPE-SWde]